MIRARAFGVPAAVVAAAAGLLSGAPAAAAGGLPIPGGAYGGDGVTGPSGEPSAAVRYVTVDAGAAGTLVEKISVNGGTVDQSRMVDGTWALPAVTLLGDASGLSANGGTLVLIRPVFDTRADETRLLVLDGENLRQRESLALDGHFSFDAISPDGQLMYLVQFESLQNPFDYRVRAYDLAADEFRPGRIVDPEEPDEQMTGQPIARQTSPDGRWAYTLYGGGEETFIHALDTEGATAVCVDLTQFGPNAAYRLGLEVDPATGVITVLERDRPAAVVDPRTFEVGAPPAGPAEEIAGAVADGIAEPDGSGGAGWIAAGGGLIALAAGAFLLLRRRRRSGVIDEDALERLVRIDSASTEEDRECDPVR